MTLVVENGAGLATAESYISLVDADQYHRDRANRTWLDAGAAEREGALREATTYLDATYAWVGSFPAGSTQALLWPRTDAYDGEGRALASNAVPSRVAQATAALAAEALSKPLMGTAPAIRSKSLGSVSVTYAGDGSARRFDEVRAILRGLYERAPGGVSGTAVRWS